MKEWISEHWIITSILAFVALLIIESMWVNLCKTIIVWRLGKNKDKEQAK